MSMLFTPAQRQNIYDTILNQLMDDNRITGILAIGTKDAVFADADDTIDLLVIIEKPSIIDIVFTLWVKRMEDLFEDQMLFRIILHEDTHQVSILLNNFLQVSVQFRALNRFHLVGDDWCIAFDRSDHIQDYLANRRQTREQHIQATYKRHIRIIWKPIVGCVRELRRDNLWKANAQLEVLRRHLVEIAGLRHLQFTQDYENMDLLPEMFLVQLRHTLPTNISDTGIRRALKVTLGLLFNETTELDMQFDTHYTVELEERLSAFVDTYA